MSRVLFPAILVLLAACGAEETSAPAASGAALAIASVADGPEPDLSRCKEGRMADSELFERKQPLAVPREFGALVKSNLTQLAVGTTSGKTLCVDTSFFEAIEDPKLSDDGRLLSFGWLGYEAYGHIVVDRSGEGQEIDTGKAPLSAPSGKRFAAIDMEEAGFGALNAFAVWDIEEVGLKRVGHFYEEMPSGDWRIDGWQGDTCVKLSVLPIDRQPEDWNDLEKTPRDPWHAAQKDGWKPAAGSCRAL